MAKVKTCYVCKQELSLDCFHNDSARCDGKQSACISCKKKEKRRRTYGYCINFEEVEARYYATNRCECCGKNFGDVASNKKCVDHLGDIIRGIICWDCNVGIGKLGDTLDAVLNTAEYLRRSTYGQS